MRWHPSLAFGCILTMPASELVAKTPAKPLHGPGASQATDRYGDALPAGARCRLGTVRLRHEQPGYRQSLVFTADGGRIVTLGSAERGAADRVIRFWNVGDGRCVKVYGPFDLGDPPHVLALSPDGKSLACSFQSRIRIWDVTSNHERLIELPNTGFFTVFGLDGCLTFTRDGKSLIFAYSDPRPTIVIWDLATNKEKARRYWHQSAIRYLACLPDNKTLVSADMEGLVHWGNIVTGESIAGPSEIAEGGVIALSPDGTALACTGFKMQPGRQRLGVLRVINGPKGARARELGSPMPTVDSLLQMHQIRGLAFSSDSKMLAAGARGTVSLWDLATETKVREITPAVEICEGLAFSPDGKTLAVRGLLDATIHLVNTKTGEEV